jgi:flagellum-specific ATP synthase
MTRATQLETLQGTELRQIRGTVSAMSGMKLLVDQLALPVGAMVRIEGRGEDASALGEVIGFDEGRSVVMMYGALQGVSPGDVVVGERRSSTVPVGDALLGRVVDGLGQPVDGGLLPAGTVLRSLAAAPVRPLDRAPITKPLWTGIRAIDAMTTIGCGQRVGIFSAAGVGKSSLLAAIANHADADVVVIALIGERGREARALIDLALGGAQRNRFVLVVSTGDESPLLRVRAAYTACTVAEHFRDQGAAVLLMMDSLTRYALAQRQIGLNAGEPPVSRGFTPSVFAQMPLLLERAGPVCGGGSITGLYTVLVEADDPNDPVADAARGMLDGHIMLSAELASRGHYPAIDLLQSVSRVADEVVDQRHAAARRRVQGLLAAYADVEELVKIGAYSGSDPRSDEALAMKPQLDALLTQSLDEPTPSDQTRQRLLAIAETHE